VDCRLWISDLGFLFPSLGRWIVDALGRWGVGALMRWMEKRSGGNTLGGDMLARGTLEAAPFVIR